MKTLKYSRQRESIKTCLMNRTDHPTADALYLSIREEFPNISLGTVYRNLGVLMEEGLVISVGHVNGQERYDATVESHPHFVCRQCHSVLDLELPDTVGGMLDEIGSRFKCSPEGYSLTIKGLCPDCGN